MSTGIRDSVTKRQDNKLKRPQAQQLRAPLEGREREYGKLKGEKRKSELKGKYKEKQATDAK
jgi:hypothetical protein